MQPQLEDVKECNTNIWEILIFPERCVGCMSCVLACAVHHEQRFDRKIASIEIDNSGKEREIDILIHKVTEGQHQACDCCEKEIEPLCFKYCPTSAISFRGRTVE